MIVFNFGIKRRNAMGDPIEGTFSIIITRDGNTWKNLLLNYLSYQLRQHLQLVTQI
jgi:hypothetical protein